MDSNNYQNINRYSKVKGPFLAQHQSESLSLKKLLTGHSSIRASDVIESYCYELKTLLENADPLKMIEGLFNLEDILGHLMDEWEFADEVELPSVNRIYLSLSPLFLRSLLNSKKGDSRIKDEWVESLRVAIENEYYFWSKLTT